MSLQIPQNNPIKPIPPNTPRRLLSLPPLHYIPYNAVPQINRLFRRFHYLGHYGRRGCNPTAHWQWQWQP